MQKEEKNDLNFSMKAYLPMGFIQFSSIFIDYAFKTLAMFAAFDFLGEKSYANQSAFIAILVFAYTLPFIVGGGLAGYVADRFSKTRILIGVKILELLFLGLALFSMYNIQTLGTFPLIITMFALSLQSVILSPGFNGLIPEKFGEKGAAEANGITGMVSSVAVLAGSAAGCILPELTGHNFVMSIVCLFPMSAIGLMAGLCSKPVPPANPQRRLGWNWMWRQFSDALKLKRKWSIFLSILGDAFFCSLSTVVLSILTIYLINTLGIAHSDTLSIGASQLLLGVGIGIGSLVAGFLSRGRIELAFVPLGALGMAIFLCLIPVFPGEKVALFDKLYIFPWLSLWFLGLGAAGGFFIVPLRAFVQCRSDSKHCGGVLASANIICFSAMMVSSLIVFLLTSGIPKAATGLWPGSLIETIQHLGLTWPPTPVFFILAGICILAVIVSLLQMPEIMLRVLDIIIGRVIYRVRISGPGKIPESGPVLLIANHITVWDALMIQRITPRPIRFVMDTTYMHTAWLRYVARCCGFIALEPDADTPHGLRVLCHKIRKALDEGEVVCVFPEGRMNRAGNISGFNSGYRALLPKDKPLPVFPVRIGFMWGSAFSPYFGDGKITLRIPRRIPLPVNITVGDAIPDARSTTPFQLRCMISDLSAFAEMDPRKEERPIHAHFNAVLHRHPFAPLIAEQSGKVINAITFWTGSVLLSQEIRKLTDKEYVAICLPNCIGMAVAVMGTLMADKTPAILNFTASKESQNISLEKVKNPIILTSKVFLAKANIEPFGNMVYLEDVVPKISKLKKIMTLLRGLFIPSYFNAVKYFPKSRTDVKRAGVILFSSGSTGNPKAVELSHHALNENVYAMLHLVGWRKTDRMMGSLPTFHSYGFTTGFWIPMVTMSMVAYVPSPLDADAVGKSFQKHKMTLLLATPTFLMTYTRRCLKEAFENLRLCIVGGEKMRVHIAEQFAEKFGVYPIEGYGSTELAPVVCVNISRIPPDFTLQSGKDGSIGPALPNLTIRITENDSLEQLPANTEGLFRVKGPSIMTGYLGDPELTAKVINDGWYNTGDLAKMDEEGYVYITGRQSRFSKVGGEMVPHERIEQVLQELTPDLDHRVTAVSALPDKERGERIVIIQTTEFPFTPEEIVNALRNANLPNLWIPKTRDFYTVEKIPLLGSGKLDLKGLKDLVHNLSQNVRT